MDIAEIREYFPITKTGKSYLDHAAKSPLPSVVQDAARHFLAGRMTDNILYIPQNYEDRLACQEILAEMINAEASRIGFVQNTSEALNLLVDNLHWEKGDEVIVFAKDFPSNVFPFLKLQQQHGVIVRVVPDHDFLYTMGDYLRLITSRTRLITISYVQFLTGQVADLSRLGEVCRRENIILCVDSIQGVGAIPFDVRGNHVDFVANGGVKWLMFPQGCSFYYFSEKLQEQFTDALSGWMDRENPFDLFNWERSKFQDSRRFYIGGGNDFGVYLALHILRLRQKIGEQFIYQRNVELGSYVKARLRERNIEILSQETFQSPIVTFRIDNASAMRQHLLAHNITISLRNGLLRISPHFYNTTEDLDRFFAVFDKTI